jgi:hypothetical protein
LRKTAKTKNLATGQLFLPQFDRHTLSVSSEFTIVFFNSEFAWSILISPHLMICWLWTSPVKVSQPDDLLALDKFCLACK